MVNSSEHFLAKAKNDTENKLPEDAYFTASELELLEKKINETKTWIEEKTKIIDAQPMHEFPTINNKLIAVQGMDLDREVKYLVNKAKIAKQERDRLKREKELKEKEEKEKAEKEKKKAKKDKKSKKDNKDDETTESTSETTEENVEGRCFFIYSGVTNCFDFSSVSVLNIYAIICHMILYRFYRNRS